MILSKGLSFFFLPRFAIQIPLKWKDWKFLKGFLSSPNIFLTLPRIPSSTIQWASSHCQKGCLRSLHPRWTWAAAPRQLEPNKLVWGINQGKTLPWINPLKPSWLGFKTQDHIGFKDPRKLCWKCPLHTSNSVSSFCLSFCGYILTLSFIWQRGWHQERSGSKFFNWSPRPQGSLLSEFKVIFPKDARL